MTLPPLPDKFDWTVRMGGHGGMIDVEVYSADQMRAYAEQAVEQALRDSAHTPQPRGYLRNCNITQRSGKDAPEWLFLQDDAGNVYCQLDGYVITPIEYAHPARESAP